MPTAQQNDEDWKRMTDACEKRRVALGLSRRGFSIKAGLQEDYYPHWVSKKFLFPSAQKLAQIHEAFDLLERVKKFEEKLSVRGGK